MKQQQFFELLQVALGTRSALSSVPNAEEWELLYKISQEHTLGAIAYTGIEQLPKEQRPPLSLSWTWNEDTLATEKENKQHHKRARQLLNHLHQDGFYAMILKGISNTNNYPLKLQKRRCPGDIDVWLWPQKNNNNPIKDTIDYCLRLTPNQYVCYIHIDFPVFSDIPVEAHIRPSFLCNPIYNRRLQKWFENQKVMLQHEANIQTEEIQNNESYYRFNAVFQLLHIFKHLFEEGIGLRQLLDYYLLLKKKEFQIQQDPEFILLLRQFGIYDFFIALLWVLQHVFDPTHPISTKEDPVHGKFLLSEIMQGGNFGKYDKRIKHGGGQTRHAWEKLKHNMRLFSHYPSEVLWEPVFRIYHYIWRRVIRA